MFKSFFLNKKYLSWSIFGTLLIVAATIFQVKIDVWINEWFGSFFDNLQVSLSTPGKISLDDYMSQSLGFIKLAAVYILTLVFIDFLAKHYVFRWRTAMTEHYMSYWQKIRHIEGASQRVQEDTMRFARIMETLGLSFLRSILSLFAFLPLLWELSKFVKTLPWIGAIDHSLVFIAIISSSLGTILLYLVGLKLPGLEFNNQKVEAALRKELVLGEDSVYHARPDSVKELFSNIKSNYYNLYNHYLYFDLTKYSYIQFTSVLPLIVLGPSVVTGIITFGIFKQIQNSFGQVDESLKYLIYSWSTIVEFLSIYKRLKSFEEEINMLEAKTARKEIEGNIITAL